MSDDQKTKILAALEKLDHADNSQWTEDGLPRTGVVQQIMNDKTIMRSHINAAAPQFVRKTGDDMPDLPEQTGDGLRADADDGAAPLPKLTNVTDSNDRLDIDRELSEDEVRSLLLRNITDAEQAVADARRKIVEGQGDEVAARKRVERAKIDYNRVFPPMSAMENIKQHLQGEAIARAERAGARGVYGAAGPSQIDLAMSRGNSRGWRRPTRFENSAPTPRYISRPVAQT